MIRATICIVLLTVASIARTGVTSDSLALARFEGAVYESGSVVEFVIEAPVGKQVSVDMGGGMVIRLGSDSTNRSTAELITNGTVRKSSVSVAPVSERPSFAFLLCGREVIHISPKPDTTPDCEGP